MAKEELKEIEEHIKFHKVIAEYEGKKRIEARDKYLRENE